MAPYNFKNSASTDFLEAHPHLKLVHSADSKAGQPTEQHQPVDNFRQNDPEGFRRARMIQSEQGIMRTYHPASTSSLFKERRYEELPFEVFIRMAADRSVEEFESNEGRHRTLTWGFTRYLKAHPLLTHLTAKEALKKILPWWKYTGFEESEQVTVLREWNRVKVIPGMTPLDWAVMMARRHPLIPPEPYLGGKTYGFFLSIAGWLQVRLGKNPIYFSGRKLGPILGVHRTTVENIRHQAVDDGLLELVERHIAGSRRSTRYRFATERYPILLEWMGGGGDDEGDRLGRGF